MNVIPLPPTARTRSPLPEAEEESLALSRAPVMPRFTCQLVAGERTLEATVTNLSLDGLFAPTDAPLPDGTEVMIHAVSISDRPIRALGRVAWCGRGPLKAAATTGLGVRFVEVYEGQDRLRSFTRRRFDLLKAKQVSIETIAPLIFLPMANLSAHRARIADCAVSPLLERMVHGYEQVGMKHRRRFLWLSTRVGMECEMLPCVDPELSDLVNDVKTLGAMVDVLMDDLADEVRDRGRLERLLAMLDHRLTGIGAHPAPSGDPYADFTAELWDEMWRLIERLPRYDELRHLLCFDWQQVITSMRYALLVGEMPTAQNLPEHDAYTPHNMHMMCNASLDLMCAPAFQMADLAVLRRAARVAQRMGRIGNMLTTWERELAASDFSSGVFPYAIHRGLLAPADLHELPLEELGRRVRDAHVERYFLLDWENLRAYLSSLREDCRSVDIGRFAAGLDELLLVQLASHGLV